MGPVGRYDGQPRHSFTQTIIDGRLKPDAKQNKDMLQVFINSGLTREQLLAEVTLQLCVSLCPSALPPC